MAGQKRTDNRGRILKDGESQRSNGTYRYRYTDLDGKRKDVYSHRLVATDRVDPIYKDEPALRDKIKQIKKDLEDGIRTGSANKSTLNEMFDLYMSGKHELKQSTRTNYIYMYKTYVSGDFGKRKIASIKYSDIKSFYISLIVERGFKPNSMEIIHTILHPVFTLAVRDGYIRSNPATGVMLEIKKSHDWEKPKRHALTIAEQEAFVGFMEQSKEYRHWLPLFTTFLGTGCRVGELVGLRWEDVDWENGSININHNLIYRVQDSGHCELHITTPKTKTGVRTIPLLSEVSDALEEEREKQKITGGNTSVIDGYSGVIFTNRYGEVLTPPTINRAISRIYKAYNKKETEEAAAEGREPMLIRHFTAHNLRHTFCTRFCENETNLKVIQEIMGHADITTTMNIYAEATEAKKKEVFANLEGKIKIR